MVAVDSDHAALLTRLVVGIVIGEEVGDGGFGSGGGGGCDEEGFGKGMGME